MKSSRYAIHTDAFDIKGISTSILWKTYSKLGIQPKFPKKEVVTYFSEAFQLQLRHLSLPQNEEYVESLSRHMKNLKANKSYRAQRLKQGLPVRGQRSRSNARTQKEKRPSFAKSIRTAYQRKTRSTGSRKTTTFNETRNSRYKLKELGRSYQAVFSSRQI